MTGGKPDCPAAVSKSQAWRGKPPCQSTNRYKHFGPLAPTDDSEGAFALHHRVKALHASKKGLERETGFEPATACLEGRNSTAELLPRTLNNRIGEVVSQAILCVLYYDAAVQESLHSSRSKASAASSTMCLPMARQAVAAGEGALSTWTAPRVRTMLKSCNSSPLRLTA